MSMLVFFYPSVSFLCRERVLLVCVLVFPFGDGSWLNDGKKNIVNELSFLFG